MNTTTEYFDIESWTGAEVQAGRTTSCRAIKLTLNKTTEQVFTVTTDVTKEGCPVVGRLPKPRVVTLENGNDVAREFYKERRKQLASLPVTRFLEEIRQATSPPENSMKTK